LIIRSNRHYLRLPPQGYAKQLGNYIELAGEIKLQEEEVGATEKVFDLRLENLGFVQL
jgi:hypothetical protein